MADVVTLGPGGGGPRGVARGGDSGVKMMGMVMHVVFFHVPTSVGISNLKGKRRPAYGPCKKPCNEGVTARLRVGLSCRVKLHGLIITRLKEGRA